MITNADCTLFNKFYNFAARADQWQRTVLHGVNWQGTRVVSVGEKGLFSADSAMVYIPFAVDSAGKYAAPKDFTRNPAGRWTLAAGDILVRGILDYNIPPRTIAELFKEADDAITITSVIRDDGGSLWMHHWEVGGQ